MNLKTNLLEIYSKTARKPPCFLNGSTITSLKKAPFGSLTFSLMNSICLVWASRQYQKPRDGLLPPGTHAEAVHLRVPEPGAILDRSQLANMAIQAKETVDSEELEVVADRGYINGEEILACEEAGITPYVAKTQTSSNQAKGLYGKRDFIYIAEDDEYECPAGERLTHRCTARDKDKVIHRYWSSACPGWGRLTSR